MAGSSAALRVARNCRTCRRKSAGTAVLDFERIRCRVWFRIRVSDFVRGGLTLENEAQAGSFSSFFCDFEGVGSVVEANVQSVGV